MKKITLALTFLFLTLATFSQIGPPSTPSSYSTMVQAPLLGITTWRTIAPNPIYDVIIAKGTESYTHNAHSFIYPNYAMPRVDTNAQRLMFIDSLGRVKVSAKYPFDNRYLKYENDPVWSGVASTYRTKVQNDLLYQPLGNYLTVNDTIGISNRINLKLNASTASSIYATISTLNGKLNISDTINKWKPIGYVPNWSSITGKPSFFSGDYNDLTNQPTIPTNTNQLTNGAGFLTSINSGMITTALGYTPVPYVAPVVNNSPGMVLGTAYQAPSNKNVWVNASVTHTIALTLLLASGSSSVALQVSSSSSGPWTTINSCGASKSLAVAVALNETTTNNVCGEVAPNQWYRLQTTVSGAGSVVISNQQTKTY